MAITNSTVAYDQETYLAKKVLARSLINCVMASLCDKDTMREGSGLTAYMVRYARMNVPVTALTEGTPPAESSFSLEQVTVTLDQWGDYVKLTDVAQLTAKHPLVDQATKLLADNAARVMDREITVVMLAGTNVQYGDGSVITRNTITSTMKMGNAVLQKSRVTMVDAGAPPMGGPSGDARQIAAKGNFQQGQAYVAVCGPQVTGDLMDPSTSLGTWVAVGTYANAKAIYNAEIGTFLGHRIVESNFLPKFTRLGNATVAVASGADGGISGFTITAVEGGGTLSNATTYYWKLTRASLQRGFEETISIEHTTATGTGESFAFAMPSTAGYVYRVYFGSSTGDANLKLANAVPAAASATVSVGAVPTSTTTAPQSLRASSDGFDPGTIHPVFIVAQEALGWTGFYNAKFLTTGNGPEKGDPLAQYRTVGYKFFGKAVIKDQTRLLRLEVASTY